MKGHVAIDMGGGIRQTAVTLHAPLCSGHYKRDPGSAGPCVGLRGVGLVRGGCQHTPPSTLTCNKTKMHRPGTCSAPMSKAQAVPHLLGAAVLKVKQAPASVTQIVWLTMRHALHCYWQPASLTEHAVMVLLARPYPCPYPSACPQPPIIDWQGLRVWLQQPSGCHHL